MSESTPNAFDEPVRVLSDLHLAHPASLIGRVESLRPLVEGARTVIFNGDTCEQSYAGWRDAGDSRLAELTELCGRSGARPVFLPGNHDPEVAERGWCELAGGNVLVTHGHAVYPSVAPWSHEYLRKKKAIWDIVRERESGGEDLAYRWETTRIITHALKPNRTRALGEKGINYLLSAVWPPGRCFNILRVWLTMVGAADRFVTRFRPETGVFLFGHFHRPGVWQRRGRLICNTGAFMRGSRPLVAELQDGTMRICAVERVGEEFRVGAQRVKVRVDGGVPAGMAGATW